MRCLLPGIAGLVVLAAIQPGHAQEQEVGLTRRLNSTPNMEQVNPMQNQKYASQNFGTRSYQTAEFGGIRDAKVKTFETRSFLGVKNPWFGRKVYDTFDNRLAGEAAKESKQKYKTEAFSTKAYANSSKNEAAAAGTQLSTATQPRPYLVPGKTQEGLSRFTENLQKDLTIDDVRDLLNKGKGGGG